MLDQDIVVYQPTLRIFRHCTQETFARIGRPGMRRIPMGVYRGDWGHGVRTHDLTIICTMHLRYTMESKYGFFFFPLGLQGRLEITY